MKNPLISIIITTKDEEQNIGLLLESIKNQSLKDFEVIVVDHPQTIDKTRKIAKVFNCRVYIKGPERSAQRNFGVSKARGKYVLVLDADMELTKDVLKSCFEMISNTKNKALIIPEKTVGNNLMAKIRGFEREMYMGDSSIEVARFFEKEVFDEFGGYDLKLTGTEDYDLPKRISTRYQIGWSKEYILHHEENLTLLRQLKKKYYYANKSAYYVDKYPELVMVQGNLLFRRAYFKNWKKFVKNPILGLLFIIVRVMETVAAVSGFIKAVGLIKFVKIFFKVLI